MSNDRLTLASVLAFIHAVLSRFFVSFTAEITQPHAGPLLIAALLALVNLTIFVYMFTTLKRLLNERYNFLAADHPIFTLIGLNALAVGLILLPAFGLGYGPFSWLSRGMALLGGLAWIWLAIRLLSLPTGQIKLLKPYAYVVTGVGISFASIILAPVGTLLNLVADILLGVIFIQETGKPEPGKIEA